MTAKAGCGIPYASFLGRVSHFDWCDNDEKFEQLWELVHKRLMRLLHGSFETPLQAVKSGLCDPVRVFVKPEPHKREKIEQGRFRLIASISIVDQLVARMLFRTQNEEELSKYPLIPSKPGLGFSQDTQVLGFTMNLADLAGTTPENFISKWDEFCVPTDCSGFDWSVPEWLLQDDLAVRNALTIDLNENLKKMRSTWLSCFCSSVFCLSDGLLLAQTEPGIQKSGSFNTSSTNSRIRYMASLYAGASWCVTMGDDALESRDTDLSVYSQLGLKCERAEELDFCSHLFRSPSQVIPKNVAKMVFGLLCGVSPTHENQNARLQWLQAYSSIMEEMRHMPIEEKRKVQEALGMIGDLKSE